MTLEIFLAIAGFVGLLITGAWALMRLVVRQFEIRLDERFVAQEEKRKLGQEEYGRRIGRIEDTTNRLERELLTLKADLPVQYQRREDHVRFETIFDARLAALNSKLDLIMERQQRSS